MEQKFTIELTSKGKYEEYKAFKKQVLLSETQFLELCSNLMKFLSDNNIKSVTEKEE